MSASLVGSEMCIRDRSPRPRSQGVDNLAEGSSAARNVAGLRAPAPEAVSYTHLTLPTICSV
eukprot:3700737-Alexandrium_andersonii.AAC.1